MEKPNFYRNHKNKVKPNRNFNNYKLLQRSVEYCTPPLKVLFQHVLSHRDLDL